MDYSAYAPAHPSEDKLAQLTGLAEEQAKLAKAVSDCEVALNNKTEELRLLSEKTIPELMDELNMQEFTTRSGLKISIAEELRASIPKARRDEAVAWLDEHGFAAIVKRKFTIMFSKDEEAWARKFEADLRKRKRQLNVERDNSVHAQTLKAWAKEQLESGLDLPLELFGIFRQRFSKLEIKK